MLTPETITSAANPLIKDVRRAVARGRLDRRGLVHRRVLPSAGRGTAQPLRDQSGARRGRRARGCRSPRAASRRRKVGFSAGRTFQRNRRHGTSQGVMALVQPREWKFQQLLPGQALVVVLDGLQDPGNAGTIVRAAEAFGATGIVFLKGTASPAQSRRRCAHPRARSSASLSCTAWRLRPRSARCGRTGSNSSPPCRRSPRRPADSLAATDLTGRCATDYR